MERHASGLHGMVQVFKMAKALAPSIIYMDEVEKVSTLTGELAMGTLQCSGHGSNAIAIPRMLGSH